MPSTSSDSIMLETTFAPVVGSGAVRLRTTVLESTEMTVAPVAFSCAVACAELTITLAATSDDVTV